MLQHSAEWQLVSRHAASGVFLGVSRQPWEVQTAINSILFSLLRTSRRDFQHTLAPADAAGATLLARCSSTTGASKLKACRGSWNTPVLLQAQHFAPCIGQPQQTTWHI
jgi:hypothetical protein